MCKRVMHRLVYWVPLEKLIFSINCQKCTFVLLTKHYCNACVSLQKILVHQNMPFGSHVYDYVIMFWENTNVKIECSTLNTITFKKIHIFNSIQLFGSKDPRNAFSLSPIFFNAAAWLKMYIDADKMAKLFSGQGPDYFYEEPSEAGGSTSLCMRLSPPDQNVRLYFAFCSSFQFLLTGGDLGHICGLVALQHLLLPSRPGVSCILLSYCCWVNLLLAAIKLSVTLYTFDRLGKGTNRNKAILRQNIICWGSWLAFRYFASVDCQF